jgi:serine protease DegS
MDLQRVGRAAIFLAGTVVGGLALAFIVVLLRPQLLRPPPTQVAAGTAAPAPPVAVPARTAPEPSIALAAPAAAAPRAEAYAAPESYAAAVQRAAPAVVNIFTARHYVEQVQPSPLDQLFGDFAPQIRQRVQATLGSGVIIDSAGHIITNHHVVENADTINVQLADGRVTSATVVGRDPDTDLAVLSIKLKSLPVMPLGRSDLLQVGDPVLAIGNPLGLSQTVTHGIVSATGRNHLGVATLENFIQTDAAINAGNSGGALINTKGELVGINTAKSGDVGVAGIGFAIPVNLARGVMQDIIDHGRVIRGWVGIVPQDIDDAQAAQLNLPHGGVVLTNMYVNSPAHQAGMRLGDIITQVDGKPVGNAQETLVLIYAKKPGTTVKLHVERGRSELDLELAVTERPRSS